MSLPPRRINTSPAVSSLREQLKTDGFQVDHHANGALVISKYFDKDVSRLGPRDRDKIYAKNATFVEVAIAALRQRFPEPEPKAYFSTLYGKNTIHIHYKFFEDNDGQFDRVIPEVVKVLHGVLENPQRWQNTIAHSQTEQLTIPFP